MIVNARASASLAAALLALAGLPALAADAPAPAAGIAELDRLFTDLHRAASIGESLELARQLHRQHPENPDVAWRLARAGFHAANQAVDKQRKKQLGWEGYEAGQQALKRNHASAEAYYWTACALGVYAEAASIFAVIGNGVASKVETLLLEAVKRDRHLNFGGPPEALGRYYFSLPWPMRDLKKSLVLLNTAVRIAPERMRSRAYLAEAYLADEQLGLAEQHYRICAAGDIARPENPDGADWRSYCRFQLALMKKASN